MIYLSDDYVEKYQDSVGYILGRAISNNYSFSFIEKTIASSSIFKEFENSNITQIAFSSPMCLYSKLFDDENDYEYEIYSKYAWLGYIYIQLFFELKITFELLFLLLPIEEALQMYNLYHEMDISQTINYVKSKMKPSILHYLISKKNISLNELSNSSGLSFSTIRSLVYGYRDIGKLELKKANQIASSLNVRLDSLIYPLNLDFE